MIKGFKQFSCSTTGFFHELVWGGVNDGKKWLGIVGLKQAIEGLISQLKNDLPKKINARFTGNSNWMATDLDALTNSLTSVYTKYKTKTMTNPNPLATSPTFIPDFFKNSGPVATNGKHFNPMYKEW